MFLVCVRLGERKWGWTVPARLLGSRMARGILLHPGPKQRPSQSRATEPYWSRAGGHFARKLCANLEGCCKQPLGKAQRQ